MPYYSHLLINMPQFCKVAPPYLNIFHNSYLQSGTETKMYTTDQGTIFSPLSKITQLPSIPCAERHTFLLKS